ncbi:MAG: hypothetical protein ACQEP1_06230 [Nanobdellota archaeon]
MSDYYQQTGLRRIFGKKEIDTIMKRLRGQPLKQTERNYMYRSIRPKLLSVEFLYRKGIAGKLEKNMKRSENTILYNLHHYGSPMLTMKKIKEKEIMPIEELIREILLHHPKARYIEAIPGLMTRNEVNTYKLLEIAINYNLQNKIGYLAETAEMISRKDKYNGLLGYLRKNKSSREEFLAGEKDKDYKDFLKKTSPQRMRKWRLYGRFFDEDFKDGNKERSAQMA